MTENAMLRRSFTFIPPALSGRQVEGTSFLPFGRYVMPDGSEQVSFGLPQPMLDAVRAIGFAGGLEQDPEAPQGYVSQNAMLRGGQGLAESAAVGSLAARAPAGALRSGMAGREALADVRIDGNTWRSSVKNPDGQEVGFVSATRDNDILKINKSTMNPDYKGQGFGVAAYQKLVDAARENGLKVKSDYTVSEDAARVYDALERRGYNVERGPSEWVQDGARGRKLQTSDLVTPPFTVSANAKPGSGVGAAMSAARNQADPQAMAAALDPSLAARLARARDMGFDTDTTWYHGTRAGHIKEFDRSKVGENFGADDEGFFFLNDPKQASEYATTSTGNAGGGSVIPTYQRMNRPFIVDDALLKREGMAPIGQTEDVVSFWDNYQGLIKDWAKADNADSIVLVDRSYKQPDGQPTMMAVQLDPRNIRSVNAMFDPAKSDSANLLAAHPMGGAVPIMFDDPEQRRPNRMIY